MRTLIWTYVVRKLHKGPFRALRILYYNVKGINEDNYRCIRVILNFTTKDKPRHFLGGKGDNFCDFMFVLLHTQNHMWESQVLLTDGQVVFLRVLRFSPTFDERSARYKWNILERAVKTQIKKKKKKKKKNMNEDTQEMPQSWQPAPPSRAPNEGEIRNKYIVRTN